LNLPG